MMNLIGAIWLLNVGIGALGVRYCLGKADEENRYLGLYHMVAYYVSIYDDDGFTCEEMYIFIHNDMQESITYSECVHCLYMMEKKKYLIRGTCVFWKNSDKLRKNT